MGNHLPQSRIGRGIDRPGRRAVGATWFTLNFNARACDQRIEHRSALETAPGPSPTAAPRNSFQHRRPQPVSHCLRSGRHKCLANVIPIGPRRARFNKVNLRGGSHQLLARWTPCARADSPLADGTRGADPNFQNSHIWCEVILKRAKEQNKCRNRCCLAPKRN